MNKIQLKKAYMGYQAKKGGLPSDFQEVEYIQCTTTQYIESGIRYDINKDLVVEMEIQSTSTYGTGFGWDGGGQIGFATTTTNNGTSTINFNGSYRTKVVHTIEKTASGSSIIQLSNESGSNSLTRTHPSLETYATKGYGIFTRFSQSSASSPYGCRLFSFKATQDGVLIGHYIPCYRKSDYEIGLYDIIGQQFYTNDGTGTFLMGRPIVCDSIDGYTQVDYIQSNGVVSQYIYTGVTKGSSIISINIEFRKGNPSRTNNEWVFGFGDMNSAQGGIGFGSDSSVWKIIKGGIGYYSFGTSDGEKHNISFTMSSNTSVVISGDISTSQTISTGSSGWTSQEINLFNSNNTSCIYYAMLIKDNVVVRNYIPMRRNSDNVLGLYDLVNDVFYTNQGSGEFLCGADIVKVDGYKQVILKESYDGTNVGYFDSGINANSNLKVEVDGKFEITDTNANAVFFCARNGFTNKDFTCVNALNSTGLNYNSRFGNFAYNYGSFLAYPPSTYHKLQWGYGGLYINGEQKQAFDRTSTFADGKSIFILAGNNESGLSFIGGQGATNYLINIKFYNQNTLLKNFIPMQRESDGVIFLYETISKEFYSNLGIEDMLQVAEYIGTQL